MKTIKVLSFLMLVVFMVGCSTDDNQLAELEALEEQSKEKIKSDDYINNKRNSDPLESINNKTTTIKVTYNFQNKSTNKSMLSTTEQIDHSKSIQVSPLGPNTSIEANPIDLSAPSEPSPIDLSPLIGASPTNLNTLIEIGNQFIELFPTLKIETLQVFPFYTQSWSIQDPYIKYDLPTREIGAQAQGDEDSPLELPPGGEAFFQKKIDLLYEAIDNHPILTRSSF